MTVFRAAWFLPADSAQDRIDNADLLPGTIRFRRHPSCKTYLNVCCPVMTSIPAADNLLKFFLTRELLQVGIRFEGACAILEAFAEHTFDDHAAYNYRDWIMYDWIMRSKVSSHGSSFGKILSATSYLAFSRNLDRRVDDCADFLPAMAGRHSHEV